MKATRVLVLGLALGLCGAACESSDKSDEKSSEKDDGDDDKKKKKKKKGDDEGDDDKKEKKKKGDDGDTKDKPAADKPTADEKTEPAPTAAPAAEPAAECGDLKTIPDIPSDKSDVPSQEEWNKGCKVNTVGPNSEAPDCEMTIVREWLKVKCTGDMKGYELMDGFGNEGQDYFKFFTPDQVLSFVIRMRKGASQKVRMCRAKERASLFVSWPPSKDKPTIIALQRGPKCDKSAWGSQ